MPRHTPSSGAAWQVTVRLSSPLDPGRSLYHGLPLWLVIRREAGIKDVRLRNLHHTYAGHAVMQGTPLPIVARLLGHAKATMIVRYAHTGDRSGRRANR